MRGGQQCLVVVAVILLPSLINEIAIAILECRNRYEGILDEL